MASILTEIAYGSSLTEKQRKEHLYVNLVANRAAMKVSWTSGFLMSTFSICRPWQVFTSTTGATLAEPVQYYPWLPGGSGQPCRAFAEHVSYKP